jgi:predicted nucleotidyltransferase component of viral defense system
MRPLYNRLQEARPRLRAPWEIIERDYLLSWILAAIGRSEALSPVLAFKGGTALKKCFFGDYRFSEDLDFSALPEAPQGEAMEGAMRACCRSAGVMLDEYAPVEIVCERYTEAQPHPGEQEAFTIRCRFPWQREPLTRIKVEITFDEPILRPLQRRSILHDYEEPLRATVRTYALVEIVAEKLRAILQHIERLEKRGWSRSRARDYYDLWRITEAYSDELDLSGFVPFLHEKCAARGVDFDGADSFFREPMMSYVSRTWEQWLGQLVPDLPSCDTVIQELRPRIDRLLA